MRKLLIAVFALLAGLAPVPTLHAAGTDSGPDPNARPVDPDYESGKKAVEAGNWKTALESFERVASRDPNSADAQNYLGYAWRKSGNLDSRSSTITRRCASTPPQGSARIHRRSLSDGEQSSEGGGAPCAARQAVLFSLRGIQRPEEAVEEYKQRAAK